MAEITICSDFGAQKNKVWHCFHCFPIYFPWSDGTGFHDLSFLNVVNYYYFFLSMLTIYLTEIDILKFLYLWKNELCNLDLGSGCKVNKQISKNNKIHFAYLSCFSSFSNECPTSLSVFHFVPSLLPSLLSFILLYLNSLLRCYFINKTWKMNLRGSFWGHS